MGHWPLHLPKLHPFIQDSGSSLTRDWNLLFLSQTQNLELERPLLQWQAPNLEQILAAYNNLITILEFQHLRLLDGLKTPRLHSWCSRCRRLRIPSFQS